MTKPSMTGYLITKVHHSIDRLFARKLKGSAMADLEPSLMGIIYILLLRDGCSIKEIADTTSFSKSTLSNMLERLENMKWIRRVHSTQDRRIVHVFLEKPPEEIHAVMGPIDAAMDQAVYKGFTQAEKEAFQASLVKIMKNLQEEDQ